MWELMALIVYSDQPPATLIFEAVKMLLASSRELPMSMTRGLYKLVEIDDTNHTDPMVTLATSTRLFEMERVLFVITVMGEFVVAL